jgi:hypothetical protein
MFILLFNELHDVRIVNDEICRNDREIVECVVNVFGPCFGYKLSDPRLKITMAAIE